MICDRKMKTTTEQLSGLCEAVELLRLDVGEQKKCDCGNDLKCDCKNKCENV